jgi:beta-phosphoglucomutase family hydrolase
MNTFDEAIADDLDQHRIGFKRAHHDLTICPTTRRATFVCGRRTDFCLIAPRWGLQRPSLLGVDWRDYDAALFDLDGVLTPTAEVHMRAWRRLFSDFLIKRGIDQPYLESDYFNYIDGKPRYDGVRAFLASRGIELAEGDPSDSAEAQTVCGLGNRKNEFFGAVLREEGVRPYAGSVRLLDHLAERGTKVAVVTSSKNATAVLEAADLRPRFGVIVDGNVAAEKGLRGKPSPDTFVAAADQLGVPVERAVVFEDAVSGVEAGHAGGFGLVVGVDRGAGAQRLTGSGADVVVADLAELAAS